MCNRNPNEKSNSRIPDFFCERYCKVGSQHVYLVLPLEVLILVFSKLLLLGPVIIYLRFDKFFENSKYSEVTQN